MQVFLLRAALWFSSFLGIKSLFTSEPTKYSELDTTHKFIYWFLIITVIVLASILIYHMWWKKRKNRR